MADWYTVLTGREWALVSWIGIALVWIVATPNLRSSFGQVLRALFRPIFLACFCMAGAYIALCVWVMHDYDFWKSDNLKTTILWTLTVAFVAMFRTKQLNDPGFYRQIIGEAFSLTALVVFVTELYTFPFIAELFLFPILLFFSLMLEMSKRDAKHKVVETFSGCILGLIVGSYVLYSIYRSFTDPATLFTLGNGRDLAAPAILTVLFLPFLYAFGVWAAYNEAFAALHIWLPERRLRAYAKVQALLRFRTDVKGLNRWRHFVLINKPTTRAEIMQSIVEAWSMGVRDRNPIPVPREEGWEPLQACRLLSDFSLGTRDYKPIGGDEWQASSPSFVIGPRNGVWNNQLTFYVSGSRFAATELTLSVDINGPKDARSAEDQFIVVGLALVEAALSADAFEDIKLSLARLIPFKRALQGATIELSRENWSSGPLKDGYELTLKLERGT